MKVTDTQTQLTPFRWSVAAAGLGIVCNVTFIVFTAYQGYFAHPDQFISSFDWGRAVVSLAILLAPSAVLFTYRHRWPVVFIYAPTLFLILIWRAQYQYDDFLKLDTPGIFLVSLGLISVVIVLVQAAISFLAIMRE